MAYRPAKGGDETKDIGVLTCTGLSRCLWPTLCGICKGCLLIVVLVVTRGVQRVPVLVVARGCRGCPLIVVLATGLLMVVSVVARGASS